MAAAAELVDIKHLARINAGASARAAHQSKSIGELRDITQALPCHPSEVSAWGSAGGRLLVGSVASLPQTTAQRDGDVSGHLRINTGADTGGDLVGALGEKGEHGIGRQWCCVA